MLDVVKEELIRLLESWERREITEMDVHWKAEELVESFGDFWPKVAQDDPQIIPLTVLSKLEILNWDLVTYRDIPFLKTTLNTEEGHEREALEAWDRYFSEAHWHRRRREILKEFGNRSYYMLAGDATDRPPW